MCFGCSKKTSHRDDSFEYPQHMFWLRNKKNNFLLRTLIWGPDLQFYDHFFVYLDLCIYFYLNIKLDKSYVLYRINSLFANEAHHMLHGFCDM